MREKNYKNFKTYFRTINIIYFAILLGLLGFMSLAYFIQTDTYFSFTEPIDKILISFGLVILFLFVPKLTYKKILLHKKSDKIHNKLAKHTAAFTVLLANYEGIGLLNTVFFFTTGNKVFLIFAAFSILYLLMLKPNPDKIAEDLNLSIQEQQYINNPERDFKEAN